MAKQTGLVTQSMTNVELRKQMTDLGEVLNKERILFRDMVTPKQHIGKKGVYDYVKAPYMWERFKEYSHELYGVEDCKNYDKFLPNPAGGNQEHWVVVDLILVDRSTMNSNYGIGASRVKINKKELNIVDYGHDLEAAKTMAYKSAMKSFGICNDVYGWDITLYDDVTQQRIDKCVEIIVKKGWDINTFYLKIEDMDTEELILELQKIERFNN